MAEDFSILSNGHFNMGIDVSENQIPIDNGNITFINDGTCYVDFENDRIKITDVIYYTTYDEFIVAGGLREDALYIIRDTKAIYIIINNEKVQLNKTVDISLAIKNTTLKGTEPDGTLQIVVKEPLPIKDNIRSIECERLLSINFDTDHNTILANLSGVIYIIVDYQDEVIELSPPDDKVAEEEQYRLLLIWKTKSSIPKLMFLSARDQIRENPYDYVVVSDFTIQDLKNNSIELGTTLWTNPNYR